MPAPKVNGFTVAYTAIGGVVLWSGIKGTTLSTTFQDLLSGKPPTQDQQNVGVPSLTVNKGSATGNGAAGSPANDVSGSANQNYLTIAHYLVQNGYSTAAAAGIVGCIAGESGGNPEAKQAGGTGEGLIQWTPGQSYGVPITGNATADLNAQLPMIISYNNAQGSGLVAMLNAQTNPVQAADFYSEHFERPAVPDSDVRAGVAESVYQQLTREAVTSIG